MGLNPALQDIQGQCLHSGTQTISLCIAACLHFRVLKTRNQLLLIHR